MTDDVKGLKPCPFCGSTAALQDPDHVWAVEFAECMSCGANVPADVWNTRPTIDRLEERVRVLEGLISEASIERLAADIAIACVDCRPEIRDGRHRAMVRLGERLRKPLKNDLAALQERTGDDAARPPDKPPISRDPPGPPSVRVA